MARNEAFQQGILPLLAGAHAFVLDLDAHRLVALRGNPSQVVEQISQMHKSLYDGTLSFTSLPIRHFKNALSDFDESLIAQLLRWIRAASAMELLCTLLIFPSMWVGWRLLNFQRFM